jgi:hypothetical protein
MGRCRLARSCRASCVRGGHLAARRESSLAGIESRSRGNAEGPLLHSDVLLHLAGAVAAERAVAHGENGRRLSHSNVLVLRRHVRDAKQRTRAIESGAVSTTCRSPTVCAKTRGSGAPLAPVAGSLSAAFVAGRRFVVVQDGPRASFFQEVPSDE